MTRLFFSTVIVFLLIISTAFAQTETLRYEIEQIIGTKNADIGVSILGIENGDTLNINGNKNYPLLSVLKFPIALTVLSKVDRGKLKMNQKIFIGQNELLPDTWSPIREKYPNGNIKLSLSDIISYTVSQSDNNGCDILLRLIGGPITVQKYINKISNGFVIKVNEEEMHKGFDIQRINTTTSFASTQLLEDFYNEKILSKKSTDFLKRIMSETSTGKNRIKGELPKNTLVIHKPGTSDTNEEGLTIATNDVGIVTLPDGNHFAISVFVSNSKESNEANSKIIADITRLTWEYFNGKTK